jgi:dTDP-4-dehydrorhamnose 3,5-epimerase
VGICYAAARADLLAPPAPELSMSWSPDAKRHFQLQAYGARPSIDGVQLVELTRHADDGGSMTELARLEGARPQALGDFTLRQINFSEVEPGVIKAFHLHARQTDVWYVPPSDRVLAVLVDVRAGSRTEGVTQRLMLGAGASRLLRIPPGVAHGMRNIGTAPARLIYFVDLHFTTDPATCDEGRLPWDHVGPEVWEITRG